MSAILKRKVQRGRDSDLYGKGEADQAWALALARAARDAASLPLDVTAQSAARRSLDEILELPPERALIALLDGPEEAQGMIALSFEVTSAVVEIQTVGKLAANPAAPRRPTRTDAAMTSILIDRALWYLGDLLGESDEQAWAGGFRYASHLEDPRMLGLLLEDQSYRLLECEISLGDAPRKGMILLALPALGRGHPTSRRRAEDLAKEEADFTLGLTEQVLASECKLEAVLAKRRLTLAEIMRMEAGWVLPLGPAQLERIRLQGSDGRDIAAAKLGQHRGMRALKLVAEGESQFGPPLRAETSADVAMRNAQLPHTAESDAETGFETQIAAFSLDDPYAETGG